MFAVVHIPNFVLQAALRHEPELWDQSVALVDPALNTPRVCAVTDTARAGGVSEGLTPTQALARVRDVRVRHRSPAQESAATDALLQCAYGFSPHLENTAPGLCTLDLRGLAELKAADPAALARWTGRFRGVLAALHLRSRIGVGPSPMVAQHAARWTDSVEIVGDARPFIASLPVAALGPSTDAAEILHKWGIRTVGELLALGQAAVVDRLGLEALALFAAAAPDATRPLNHARPADRFEEAHEFEDGIETLEPLLFLLRRFADQISHRLALGGQAAEHLTLRLKLDNGEALERRLRVPQPTHQADILFRMLHTHLETLRTEAPVVAVGLAAEPCSPEQKQFGLFETALRDPHQFQETLARLSALLGADRVGTPLRLDGHRPDAFKMLPPDFENAPVLAGTRRAAILQPTALRRFRPALTATVQTETQARDARVAPVTLHCSVAQGRLQVALGPWRASGNWWDAGAWEREEWDVAMPNGQPLRLAKTPAGWRVEGMVD
jgi:protein ImuB